MTLDSSSRDASRSRRRSSIRSSSRRSCSSSTRSTPPSYDDGSSIRPTSYPCVGGRYLPVAPKCRTSAAAGVHDGAAQPRMQGTIGWALLGERDAHTSPVGSPGLSASGPGQRPGHFVSSADPPPGGRQLERLGRAGSEAELAGARRRSTPAGTRCTGAPPRPRRSRRPPGPAPRGRAGSRGWARAPTAPGPGRASRPCAGSPARGGSRCARTRTTRRRGRSARASSASTAQASDDAG